MRGFGGVGNACVLPGPARAICARTAVARAPCPCVPSGPAGLAAGQGLPPGPGEASGRGVVKAGRYPYHKPGRPSQEASARRGGCRRRPSLAVKVTLDWLRTNSAMLWQPPLKTPRLRGA